MAKSHSRSRSKSRSPHSRSRRSRSSKSRSRSRSRNHSSKSSSHHHHRKSSRHRSPGKSSPSTKPHSSSSTGATSSVLEACWKPVRHDPSNFDAWTHLLQCVENLDDTKSAREAFDSFLAKFPYCFGYWRKYAEFWKKHKKPETVIEVFERGVSAIPLSVDLWLAYLAFLKEHLADDEHRRTKINALYEKALEACGLEFRSDKLWEEFIGWHVANEEYRHAMDVYDRMLRVPLLLYSAHFDKLQDFVNTYEPHEILSEAEFDKLYKEIEEKLSEQGLEIFVGDESANGKAEDENGDEPKADVLQKKYSDEALKLFRLSVLDKRRKVHLKTETEVSKRWSFEEAIKRPYFHVKPLERTQLRNWRHYLDFEVQEGNQRRVVTLFERCLIACALYEDIWVRYARYMESVNPQEVRAIFKRACEVHMPHKATMHLLWATFEEKQKNYDYARSVLTNFEVGHPGSVLVLLRRTNIEVRRALDQHQQTPSASGGDFSIVCKEFERLIAEAPTTKVATFFAVKYARFHEKIRKDFKMAEKILLDAAKRDQNNPQLYMMLVQMAFEQQPFDMDQVLVALDRAMEGDVLQDAEKLQFSQRKLELLEDFCPDVEQIQKHYEAHIKLYKNLGYSTSKKRPPPLGAGGPSDEKRSRIDVPITPTLAAAAMPTSAPYYDYHPHYGGANMGRGGHPPASMMTYQPPMAPAPAQTYGYYVHAPSSANIAIATTGGGPPC